RSSAASRSTTALAATSSSCRVRPPGTGQRASRGRTSRASTSAPATIATPRSTLPLAATSSAIPPTIRTRASPTTCGWYSGRCSKAPTTGPSGEHRRRQQGPRGAAAGGEERGGTMGGDARTAALETAQDILKGRAPLPDFAALQALLDALKDALQFGKARKVIALALGRDGRDDASASQRFAEDESRWLVQQLALCTYKDEELLP